MGNIPPTMMINESNEGEEVKISNQNKAILVRKKLHSGRA